MANIKHTLAAAENPTAAPPSIGAHYTNTLTGARWISRGVATVADWGQPLTGSPVLVGNDVTEFTVDIAQPSVIWRMTNDSGPRSIIFPLTGEPGLFVVELVIDNSMSWFNTVTIDKGNPFDEKGEILGRTEFMLYPNSRNYYKFAYYINQSGDPCWRILEETPLHMLTPRAWFGAGAEDTLTLGWSPTTTIWPIDGPRTLILPEIPIANLQFFLELQILFNAKFAGECVVTIDTVNGLPLIGHATLTIPADSAVLYKLACFMDNGNYYWSVVSVTTLTA